MKYNFTIISVFFLGFAGYGQNEYYPNLRHDNTWIFGAGGWGNRVMNFDSGKVNLVAKTSTVLGMGRPSVILSDEVGNLQFFTNGRTVVNREYKVMKNGARINPGSFMDDNNWTDGLPLPQSTLALAFPSNDSIYYLLHQDCAVKLINNYPHFYAPLYFSKINMNLDNELGALELFNQPVNNDSVTVTCMTACRHANGRDWWVVAKQPYLSIYNFYLAAESGPKFVSSQKVNVPDGVKNEAGGQAIFTPNGQKYIQVSAPFKQEPAYIDIYDFDRCAGLFDSHQRIMFDDSVYYVVCGAAVSPNSRFLYVSRWDYILQFDLESPDILASMDTVATYDGFFSPTAGGCRTTFMSCQLAIDGKIYISVGPCATEYLHVIHEPNKKGSDCNVEQHGIYLAVNNLFMIPNAPNYKLGKLKGSPCDTLTVGNKDITSDDYGLKIFPNPASTQIQVDLSLPDFDPAISTEIVFVGISGEIVQKYAMPDFVSLATLDISKLASGVYGVQLRQRNRVLAVEKLVVVR